MAPTQFPEANKVFPKAFDTGEGLDIHAFTGSIQGGCLDGMGVIIVAWQPSLEDVARIVNGAPVFLACMGDELPPHTLTTVFPG